MAEYYDIQQVTEKLRKSEDEVQNLIKEGRLRQYMDSGKAVFKVEEVDALAEEIVGLDISSIGDAQTDEPEEIDLTAFGEQIPDEGSDVDIMLEETSEIQLAPDEDEEKEPSQSGADDIELDLEPDLPDQKESEGGFGLSQMGDLTMADTNVGTVGINILSGTGDAYQLTEDTKAETQAADIDDLDSLDADANLESFGSGSGLLDLSLQADDTSLGAVLDDILPTGAEGGDADAGNLGVDESMGLLDEVEDLGAVAQESEEAAVPMGAATAAPVIPVPGTQMVAVAQVDPKSNMFGVMMIFPLLGIIAAIIALTAAIQGVMPSLVKTLVETEVAGFSLIWAIVAGLVALVLILLLMASVSGGGSGAQKTKAKKAKKSKKEKPAKKKKRK